MKTPGSARQAAVSWVSQSSLLFLTLTSWLLILQCGVVVRSTGVEEFSSEGGRGRVRGGGGPGPSRGSGAK